MYSYEVKLTVPGGYPFGFLDPRYSSNNSNIINNITVENMLRVQINDLISEKDNNCMT